MTLLDLPQPGNKILCSCGAEIGSLIAVRDSLWLQVGDVQLRYGHGRCTSCLKIWHYDSMELVLNRLVNRAIMGRTKYSVDRS